MADAAVAGSTEAFAYLGVEARILLHTIGGGTDDEELRALLAEADLHRLFAIATAEKAVDPIWRRINGLLGERRREAGAASMQKAAMVAQFRMAYLRQRMRETLSTLARLEVPVVLLKGAGLALSVYPTFDDRPMGDVDILVPRGAVPQAWAALRAADWRTLGDEATQEVRYEHHHHLPVLMDSSGVDVPLEVHTDLMSDGHPFRFGAADVWEHAVSLGEAGEGAMVPHPTHQLLHCVIHFLWNHEGRSGGWRALRDVSAITARGIAWDEFVPVAIDARAGSCAYWTLWLAARLGGVPVPESVLSALRPKGSAWRMRTLERHLSMQLFAGGLKCPSVRLGRRLWEAAVRPGASGHGAARPWMWEELFAEPAEPALKRGSSRVLGQLRSTAAWSAYVTAVATGRTDH